MSRFEGREGHDHVGILGNALQTEARDGEKTLRKEHTYVRGLVWLDSVNREKQANRQVR